MAAGELAAAQAGLRLAGSFITAYDLYNQSNFVTQQAEINARYLELAASEAERRGDKQSRELEKEGQKFLSSQRASVVGQGVALDSDVAIQLRQQAEDLIADDAQEIRNQAWEQAFGYRSEADSVRGRAKVQQARLRTQAFTTLLGGASGAVGAAQDYNYYQARYGTTNA